MVSSGSATACTIYPARPCWMFQSSDKQRRDCSVRRLGLHVHPDGSVCSDISPLALESSVSPCLRLSSSLGRRLAQSDSTGAAMPSGSVADRLQREIDKIDQTLPPELPPANRQVLAYNLATRNLKLPDRHCPACDKRYRLVGGEESGRDRVKEEQHRSGICSEACFQRLTGASMFVKDYELDTPDRPRPDVRSHLQS